MHRGRLLYKPYELFQVLQVSCGSLNYCHGSTGSLGSIGVTGIGRDWVLRIGSAVSYLVRHPFKLSDLHEKVTRVMILDHLLPDQISHC